MGYEDLVHLAHVDSHGKTVTLEEEALIQGVLVGEHLPDFEERSATNWVHVTREAAMTASKNVYEMQWGDNIFMRWAFMVGKDLHDEARLELDWVETHSPYIVEVVRPYFDIQNEKCREMALEVLWWVNVAALVLVWYFVFYFVSCTLGFVLRKESIQGENTIKNQQQTLLNL